jgi:hypothetical protein
VDAPALDAGDQVGNDQPSENTLDDHPLEVLGAADAGGAEFAILRAHGALFLNERYRFTTLAPRGAIGSDLFNRSGGQGT